jgi:formate-dependent nitrite reductase membrane component NrfD
MGKARRVYDAPDKGILWGWEVSAYLVTKAIAAGVILVGLINWLAAGQSLDTSISWSQLITSFVFLMATGVLLVMDLDRPDRFLNVLFRPQSKSWLVKGGYAITLFGLGLTIMAIGKWFEWTQIFEIASIATGAVGLVVAIYTAYLFAQAKGRDFWQSPMLPIHMLTHSILAGAAFLALLNLAIIGNEEMWPVLRWILIAALMVSAAVLTFELSIDHPTDDAKRTADSIVHGSYRNRFWLAVVAIGIVLPASILIMSGTPAVIAICSILILLGIIYSEHIWVEAPQKITLS